MIDYTAKSATLSQVQHNFRSYDQKITTIKMNKISLSAKDPKRYYFADGITSLPHGHWRIAESEAADLKIIPACFAEKRESDRYLESLQFMFN